MKSLLLCPELFAAEGGIARILRLYLKAMGGAGEVRLVVLNDTKIPQDRVRLYASPARAIACGRRKTAFLLAALREARGCDRLVCGHVHLLPVAWLIQWIYPTLDYYLVAHGIEVWRPYGLFERLALRGARRIFCVSDYTRRRILENITLSSEQLQVVPNALDPYFAEAPSPSGPHGTGEHGVILAVSRLDRRDSYKGVDHLIQALSNIRTQIPSARLRIVGIGDDLERLKGQASKHGVKEAVDFLGRVDDAELNRQYADCQIFALPSELEGFGLVYLEAMAHGKACVGARAGGVPEVIDATSGELVSYGNIDEIASACIRLLRVGLAPDAVRARARQFDYASFQSNLNAAF